ncbi:MAG: PQQ-binding-like beta-propeller repeat protein [Candidatus Marinimicrobia bacterium]|nr:PQQ-binding-like beta-propeller repeat protein [Candidatus Neomarinimicrobiota bacterium]
MTDHLHSAAKWALLGLWCLSLACTMRPRFSPLDGSVDIAFPRRNVRPEIAWEVKLASPVTYLRPINQKALLVASHRGQLYRLDLETGKRKSGLWQVTRKAITSLVVAESTGSLYFASAQARKVYGYDLSRGKKLWQHKGAVIEGPLAVHGGLLLAAGATGQLTAFDLADGTVRWQRKLPGRVSRGVRRWADDLLVLNDHGSLYSFDLGEIAAGGDEEDHTTAPAWRRDLEVDATAVLALGSGLLLVGDSQGRLIALEPGNGQTRFETNLGAPIYGRPLITEGYIVVATADGTVLGLRPGDGSVVWEYAGEGLVKLPVLAWGSNPAVAVVIFSRGVVVGLDIATGERLWRHELEGPIQLAALTPSGVLLVRRHKWLQYITLVPQQPGAS